ncbi:MAG: hypothetical protein E6J90_41700 [Deltaproteobacteria bacterium]|nr:MAG: hypothetical protein E6J90_41700 [Deltaproteobacteria bacterium]
MGAKRVIWHVGFERNLRRRGPTSFEVRSEVPLSEEPSRLDYLLLRKLTPEGEPVDNSAQTLRHLWPLLPRVSVVEYKSPGHPYRSGQLDRLWGYVHTYFANQRALPRHRADGALLTPAEGGPEVREREDLCAVLVVAARAPSLDADVEAMSLTWEDLGSGYLRVHDGLFTLYVVELDVAGPAEGDDLLHSFGHGTLRSPEARWFWMELVGSKEAAMNMQDMEGYKELMAQMLDTLPAEQRLAGLSPEQRLAGLPPEQRLAGLPPEQRLAGLDRDHQALALPVEVLRLLPEAYLRSLSPEVEGEIRRRLRQNGR